MSDPICVSLTPLNPSWFCILAGFKYNEQRGGAEWDSTPAPAAGRRTSLRLKVNSGRNIPFGQPWSQFYY